MNLARRRALPAALAALALLAAACGGSESPDAEEEQAVAEDPAGDGQEAGQGAAGEDAGAPEPVLSVVATVAPVSDLVARVGGDRVAVTSLVPAGGDAHTYEPRPQDVVILSEADAYFGIGLELNDGALALAEESLPEGSPLLLLGEAALTETDLVFDHSHGEEGGHSHGGEDGHSHGEEDGHSHGEEDGHSHGEEEGHSHGEENGHSHGGEDGHSHGEEDGHSHGEEGGHSHGDGELGPNPHVWTSLRNASALVSGIADALTELDPDGAETYAENASAFQEELGLLDQQVEEATASIPAASRTLVTYHDAWTYFARDYDLDYATAVQPADFSEPSAAEVRAVIDEIRALGVEVVFGSEVFPTPVLETIAEETGAQYVSDLSDDVLPGDPGDPEHTYLEMMRRNAQAIVDGLGGDVSPLN